MSRGIDLAAARRDVQAFADAVDCPLTTRQAEPLRLQSRVSVIVAPRQSGKSRSLTVLALWWAFRNAEQRVLVVSAGDDAAKRLLADVRRLAAASPVLRGSVVDESSSLLTLTNGSEIRSVPASERQVRGWPVDLLLVDECALVSDDLLLGAALPTVAARPDARIVLASSASSAQGAFFDFAVRGQGAGSEHVRTFRWTLADAPWITASHVAAARESMSALRFAAEYEGVFASSSDAVFTRAQLDRVTADYRLRRLEEIDGAARLSAGFDWGFAYDRSCCVVVGRLPQVGPRRFGVVAAHSWPVQTSFYEIAGDVAGMPGNLDSLVSETSGMGEGATQELFRQWSGRPDQSSRSSAWSALVRIATTGQLKGALYSTLRTLIEREALLLPASAVDLRRELELLRVELAPSGERIEARSGGHDDLPDALCMALGPYRRVGGRWRSTVGKLAVPESQVFDPAGPLPEDVPVTATGGGLAVPVDPVWQSIEGGELTYPHGFDPSRPPEPYWMAGAREQVLAALAASEKPMRGTA